MALFYLIYQEPTRDIDNCYAILYGGTRITIDSSFLMPIKYHPSIPAACPPKEAKPTTGVVYRASKKPTLAGSDFASHAERKLPGYDPKVCQCLGAVGLGFGRSGRNRAEAVPLV